MMISNKKEKEIEGIITNLGFLKKNFEDKNVLITRGSGILGSWICEVLVEWEARVICLDNLVSGLKSNIFSLREVELEEGL